MAMVTAESMVLAEVVVFHWTGAFKQAWIIDPAQAFEQTEVFGLVKVIEPAQVGS